MLANIRVEIILQYIKCVELLYTLNTHNVICHWYLNKVGIEK